MSHRARIGKMGRMLAGWGLVVTGVVIIPLPIPSSPLLLGGLALLAEEYIWAQKALEKGKRAAHNLGDRMHHHHPKPETKPPVDSAS